jgi:hypothetical protein
MTKPWLNIMAKLVKHNDKNLAKFKLNLVLKHNGYI